MARFWRGLFRSVEQTSDRSIDKSLRSRYYRLSREQLWPMVIEALAAQGDMKLTHEAKSAGEILLTRSTITGRVQDITVSLLQINPLKTSVDVYSASRDSMFRFGDLGSNYRVIQRILNRIEQKVGTYRLPNA
jgi:hypothetical protein